MTNLSEERSEMIDLNKTLLRCPHCHGMPVAVQLEVIEKGNQREARVRCWDCGKDYWVTWDESKSKVLSAEEELALIKQRWR